MDSQFDLETWFFFFPDSRCFTHRQILRPYSKSTKKLAVLFTPIETKSVSDAECIQLLKQGPVILMERFRDVACSTGSNMQGTMPTVTSQFLSRHTVRMVMNSTVQHWNNFFKGSGESSVLQKF